jgi:signal transduction histidine kinase
VYGAAESLLGLGVVAGSVASYESRGRLVGELVHRALAGGPPDPSQTVLAAPNRCVADARAMQRWSLDEQRLPDGCDIRFADRPLWRQYEWEIAATLAIIAGQATLIGALIVQRRRRRAAELESQTRYLEVAHMNRRVALGEMSASIAHELNQPLGAIRNNAGAAEILIKSNPPRLKEVADILADIQRDDQRASDIIERIRKLLRKTPFEVRDMDLNETIDDTLRLAAGEAADKAVVIRTELEPGLPRVSADRVQLQQVILNLVLNAIEAMHRQAAHEKVLTVRSARLNGKEAEVSVADSGAGIPNESLARIFDPFVSSKPGGMGLGLAISRSIVETHGGAIRAENAAHGGAVFRFTLPFAEPSRA